MRWRRLCRSGHGREREEKEWRGDEDLCSHVSGPRCLLDFHVDMSSRESRELKTGFGLRLEVKWGSCHNIDRI